MSNDPTVAEAVRRYLSHNIRDGLAVLAEEPALVTPQANAALRDWVRWFRNNGQPDTALDVEERLAYLEFAQTTSPARAIALHDLHGELIDTDDEPSVVAILDAHPNSVALPLAW